MDEVQGGAESGDERRGADRRSDERRAAEADAARPLQVRCGKVIPEDEGSSPSRAEPQGESPGERVARDRRRTCGAARRDFRSRWPSHLVLITILVMQSMAN